MGDNIAHNAKKAEFALLVCIALVLLALIGGITLTASVPPVSRDALTHHLALPKLYLKHGGLVELPDIPFSYYPMNLDLLYLAALAWGNDIVPKYMHMVFALFTGGLMYHYLRGRIGTALAMMGALVWLSTPIVVRLASEVYVDLGVAFFGFASIYVLTRWMASGFNPRLLVWSAVWCGLALGTKYNALLILAILSLMVPFIRSKGISNTALRETYTGDDRYDTLGHQDGDRWWAHTKPVISAAICFVLIALAVFSPWMIRNTILKQNPIYPMLKGVFNPQEKMDGDWSRTSTMVQDTSGTMVVRHLVFGESLGYMALMPVRIFFEGRDDSPRHFDGRLNPFLLLFAIAGFLPLGTLPDRLRQEQRVWCWFAVLFILMAFFTAPIRIRYLVPALPAIVVLSMTGIYRIWNLGGQVQTLFSKRLLQLVVIGAVVAMLGYNGDYFADRFQKVAPLGYLSGKVSRTDYISERLPEYPVIEYINEKLSSDAVILGLFLGQRRYYFDRDLILSENVLKKCIQGNSGGQGVLSMLRGYGITHLMIREDLFIDWTQSMLNNNERATLSQFWNSHVKKIADNNGYFLYAIEV